jgi:hypothetical protein
VLGDGSLNCLQPGGGIKTIPAMKQNDFAGASKNTPRISRRTAVGMGATIAAGMLLDMPLYAAPAKQKLVVVWSEGTANVDEASKKVYPDDINTAIAEGLKPLQSKGWEIVKARPERS